MLIQFVQLSSLVIDDFFTFPFYGKREESYVCWLIIQTVNQLQIWHFSDNLNFPLRSFFLPRFLSECFRLMHGSDVKQCLDHVKP